MIQSKWRINVPRKVHSRSQKRDEFGTGLPPVPVESLRNLTTVTLKQPGSAFELAFIFILFLGRQGQRPRN